MAGILANSASATMTGSDAAADQSISGYLRNERVTLTTTPTGSTYAWSLTNPNGSSPTRAALTDETASNPSFSPDVQGTYTVTATVDGSTSYTLRLSALNVAAAEPVEVLRLQPRTDAQVTAPSVGVALYYSSTQASLCVKTSSDAVRTVTTVAT